MPILSDKLATEICRYAKREHRLSVSIVPLNAARPRSDDPLSRYQQVRRQRDSALQQSIDCGAPHLFQLLPGLCSWVSGLEHRRVIHAGLLGGEVLLSDQSAGGEAAVRERLLAMGMDADDARRLVDRMPARSMAELTEAAAAIQETFYDMSGWTPLLMRENRRRVEQRRQLNEAMEEMRRRGGGSIYAFEKERLVLAHVRAGNRQEARSVLNEMLAAIYLSAPQLVVLRARTIEMISCLTRAAIEDNPLLEPFIERMHLWTEALVRAPDDDTLSRELMKALDEFLEGIHLHAANRSNTKVRRALDFIAANYASSISLRDVAAEVGLSACRLSHLVKEHTGKTVLQIIQQVRIRRAQTLLQRTHKSCAEIAYDVGFNDQSYFIRHFKRLTGSTPARYRRGR